MRTMNSGNPRPKGQPHPLLSPPALLKNPGSAKASGLAPTDLANQVRTAMPDALNHRQKADKRLARQPKAELNRLEEQEESLIDFAAEGGMAVSAVTRRCSG